MRSSSISHQHLYSYISFVSLCGLAVLCGRCACSSFYASNWCLSCPADSPIIDFAYTYIHNCISVAGVGTVVVMWIAGHHVTQTDPIRGSCGKSGRLPWQCLADTHHALDKAGDSSIQGEWVLDCLAGIRWDDHCSTVGNNVTHRTFPLTYLPNHTFWTIPKLLY